MKRIIVILSCILLLLVMFAVICSLPFEKDYGQYLLLNTPIGELYFTERWEEDLCTEEIVVDDGYAVDFSTQISTGMISLSKLYIGTETTEGFLVGYVNNMQIRWDMPEVEQGNGRTAKDIDIVNSIQEDLVSIVDQIVAMEGFHKEQVFDTTTESFGEYALLSTPLGDLYFTERWKNFVVTENIDETEGYAVRIFAQTDSGKAKLYELYIGAETDAGIQLGYVDDVEIRIDVFDVELGDGWTEADTDIAYAIQEDLDCLVDQIAEMDGFTSK